jgi:hypothetical protein
MPQSRHDDPDDRDFNVGPCLIEDEEIKACALGEFNAGKYLITRVMERLRA